MIRFTPLTRISLVGLILTLMGQLTAPVSAQKADVKTLVRSLPPGANMILMVNVERLQSTELAGSREWTEMVRSHYSSGLGEILRTSRFAIVAANVSQRFAEPIWRAALLVENNDKRFPQLSRAFSGNVDKQLGIEFIEMENDSFVLAPRRGWIGIFSPAERQYFSHWMSQIHSPDNWIAGTYLQRAVDGFDPYAANVVIAADLKHAYSRLRILDDVRDSELLAKHNIDPKEFATLGSSVEGFTITTNIGDAITGNVAMTFANDITSLNQVARDLVFDFLDDAGIEIPEMENWQVVAKDNRIELNGPLSMDGFRLMVSQMDMIDDMPAWVHYDRESVEPGAITREYFKTVEKLVEDSKMTRTANTNFASNANWMERYSKRIRRLPTQFVDREVVDFADEVITTLIESATLLRNTGEKNKSDQAGLRRNRSSNDFGTISMSGSYRRNRFGRFSRPSGGTGKYERQQAAQQNAESAFVEINLKFEELAKRSLELQRDLEAKYDLEY